MSSFLLQVIRDAVLLAGTAVVAEVSTSRRPVADAFLAQSADLVLYVLLAVFASVARGFFDARDGKIPDRQLLLRACVVAAFVGVVGGVLISDLSWRPGTKMAAVSLCSFFLDWSIPAVGRAWRGWLTRIAAPPDTGSPPRGGGEA